MKYVVRAQEERQLTRKLGLCFFPFANFSIPRFSIMTARCSRLASIALDPTCVSQKYAYRVFLHTSFWLEAAKCQAHIVVRTKKLPEVQSRGCVHVGRLDQRPPEFLIQILHQAPVEQDDFDPAAYSLLQQNVARVGVGVEKAIYVLLVRNCFADG